MVRTHQGEISSLVTERKLVFSRGSGHLPNVIQLLNCRAMIHTYSMIQQFYSYLYTQQMCIHMFSKNQV